MRIAAYVLATLSVVALAAPAEAYRYLTCNIGFGASPLKWSSNTRPILTYDVNFPAGTRRNAIQNVIDQFNKNPSKFTFVRVNHSGPVGRGNGLSEVWASSSKNVLDGAPARTFIRFRCDPLARRLTEADVVFDAKQAWAFGSTTTTLSSYGGSKRFIRSAAMHEFGHAAGFLHVNTTYNVMGIDYTHVHSNGGITYAYLGEDTSTGTVFLYGLDSSAPQNLAVAHWEYSGKDGEYSTHKRTALYPAGSSTPLPTTLVGAERAYRVKAGQSIDARFTYENLGRATVKNAEARFYISTNNLISTADRLIRTSSIASLGRDKVSTFNRRLTIPTNLTVGTQYWVGVRLTPVAGEQDTTDNATYTSITVIP